MLIFKKFRKDFMKKKIFLENSFEEFENPLGKIKKSNSNVHF